MFDQQMHRFIDNAGVADACIPACRVRVDVLQAAVSPFFDVSVVLSCLCLRSVPGNMCA